MTDRSKLLALAEAVEKLSGADREVDAEIALSLGLVGDNTVAHASGWCVGGRDQPQLSPAYTASLDAAMTLVPDICTANLMMGKGRPNAVQVHHFLPGALIPNKQSIASAATPALALTAASLRAQAEALS